MMLVRRIAIALSLTATVGGSSHAQFQVPEAARYLVGPEADTDTDTVSGLDSNFTSLLVLAPGRDRLSATIVHNGTSALPARSDRQQTVRTAARPGQNTIQASLVTADSGPGFWRFDFNGVAQFRPGSLRVEAGEVLALNARTVVFRTGVRNGEGEQQGQGDVIRFVYDLVP